MKKLLLFAACFGAAALFAGDVVVWEDENFAVAYRFISAPELDKLFGFPAPEEYGNNFPCYVFGKVTRKDGGTSVLKIKFDYQGDLPELLKPWVNSTWVENWDTPQPPDERFFLRIIEGLHAEKFNIGDFTCTVSPE